MGSSADLHFLAKKRLSPFLHKKMGLPSQENGFTLIEAPGALRKPIFELKKHLSDYKLEENAMRINLFVSLFGSLTS